MTLLFIGPGGSFEARWLVYALLRDNVLHHLQHGQLGHDDEGERFSALHAVAGALGAAPVRVPAIALGRDVSIAMEALEGLPASEMAISERTRAVLRLAVPPRAPGPTELLAGAGIRLPLLDGHLETLGDACAGFAVALERITRTATEREIVEVREV